MKHLLLFSTVFLAMSCSVAHKTASLVIDDRQLAVAGAVHAPAESPTPVILPASATFKEEVIAPEIPVVAVSVAPLADENTLRVSSAHKAHSFSDMKKMADAGEIIMSKSDRKILNKLDKQFKGNFNQFRRDSEGFELTPAAKIIGIIGIVALVIALFGSWFFAFIFLLAVAAFLLKWFHVIQF